MVGWLFDFRGRIDRIRYCAGISLVVFGALAATALLAVIHSKIRVPMTLTGLPVVLGMIWASFALVAKRLRDIGLTVWLLPVCAAIGFVDHLLAAHVPWRCILPDEPVTPIGGAFELILAAVLILWPGKPLAGLQAGRVGQDAWRRWAPIGMVTVTLVASVLIDPLAPKICLGNARAGADCPPFGFAGRYYTAALLARANQFLDQDKATSALPDLDRIADIRPNYVFALRSRGQALQTLGQTTAALFDYDRALTLAPDYLRAHAERGLIYQNMQNAQAAAEDFTFVYNAGPNSYDRDRILAYTRSVDRSSLLKTPDRPL